MSALPAAKLGLLKRLVELAPDPVLRSLDAALGGQHREPALIEVARLVSREIADRRLRDAVFAVLTPLCCASSGAEVRLSLPRDVPGWLWRGLKAREPERIDAAATALHAGGEPEQLTPLLDELCALAAREVYAHGARAFASESGEAESGEPQSAPPAGLDRIALNRLSQALAMSPPLRGVLARLPVWARNLDEGGAASLRLAFRDCLEAAGGDAGPLFMEILHAALDEPWRVLRLISGIMDRPSDTYLAGSEMASFGERYLAELDACLARVRTLDPAQGDGAGQAAAAAVQRAHALLEEFDQWVAVSPDGPWGRRLTEQKKALFAAVESVIKACEGALDAALPARAVRAGLKVLRYEPKLAHDPDPALAARARAFLTFLQATRSVSAQAGFGAARAKAVEASDKRVDQYVEDLLASLDDDAPAATARAMAYLELAADLMGLIREPAAAQIVRRRMAAAARKVLAEAS